MQVGMQVRVIGNCNEHCHKIGSVVTITDMRMGQKRHLYQGDGRCSGWMREQDFEPVMVGPINIEELL